MSSVRAIQQNVAEVSADRHMEARVEVLRNRLVETARSGGFAGAVYMHLGHGLRGAGASEVRMAPRRLVATAGFDEGRYIRRGYLETDPLAARAFDDLQPFVWSLAELRNGPSARRGFVEVMETWGMGCGVIAPVHDYSHGPAFLNLFLREPTWAAKSDFGVAMVAAVEIHTRALALASAVNEAAEEAHLSIREIAVLRFAALGLTEQETAVELALSRRGVQFHLARAMAKLGAPNKTATVAKAVSVGLIRL